MFVLTVKSSLVNTLLQVKEFEVTTQSQTIIFNGFTDLHVGGVVLFQQGKDHISKNRVLDNIPSVTLNALCAKRKMHRLF